MDTHHDFTGPLPMHGVDDTRGLASYVRQVASAIGVPADGTSFEESDTTTAYIGLPDRVPTHPGRDLMLVWDETVGWRIETEPTPGEPPSVLGRLRGDPSPETVAEFVADIVEALGAPVDNPA